MHDGELRRILQDAEHDVEWDKIDAKKTVMCVQARRALRRRRRTVIAAVPVVILVCSWFELHTSKQVISTVADRTPASGETTIDELPREFELNLQALRTALSEVEQDYLLHEAQITIERHQQYVSQELDIVAAQLIYRADCMLQDQRPVNEVVSMYHEILQLFPDTYAADEARARLKQTVREGGI